MASPSGKTESASPTRSELLEEWTHQHQFGKFNTYQLILK